MYGLPEDEDAARVVLVPVPYEATVSYGRGTAEGPALIRRASGQIDLYDLETGHPYEAGIVMRHPDQRLLELDREAKRADVEAVNGLCREMNDIVRRAVAGLLQKDKVVGTVGGDHSVAFGAIAAHGDVYGDFGILHIDAHADLREAYEGFTYSHASVMERVLAEVPAVTHLVQVGIRDLGSRERARIDEDARIRTTYGPELAWARLQGNLLHELRRVVSALPPKVYVSFDVDGLDPRYCPGTGTPVPGGLEFEEASILLGLVAEQRQIIGFDLVEVAGSEWDGNVGARLLYKLIGWTLQSQRG